MKMRKTYINSRTGETTASATQAMKWHRAGDHVQVNTFYNEPRKTGLANVVHVPGAILKKKTRLDENTAHCKAIANDIDDYVSGNIRTCPHCGETIQRNEWDMFWFQCPECGVDSDPDTWDQKSVWDYLSDVYNVEFRVSGKNADYPNSVQIMIACGGPNIYLDTATKDVELYWWTEKARWPLSYAAVEALDEWAAKYWGCM